MLWQHCACGPVRFGHENLLSINSWLKIPPQTLEPLQLWSQTKQPCHQYLHLHPLHLLISKSAHKYVMWTWCHTFCRSLNMVRGLWHVQMWTSTAICILSWWLGWNFQSNFSWSINQQLKDSIKTSYLLFWDIFFNRQHHGGDMSTVLISGSVAGFLLDQLCSSFGHIFIMEISIASPIVREKTLWSVYCGALCVSLRCKAVQDIYSLKKNGARDGKRGTVTASRMTDFLGIRVYLLAGNSLCC